MSVLSGVKIQIKSEITPDSAGLEVYIRSSFYNIMCIRLTIKCSQALGCLFSSPLAFGVDFHVGHFQSSHLIQLLPSLNKISTIIEQKVYTI